jgi:ankyrin repeat protein
MLSDEQTRAAALIAESSLELKYIGRVAAQPLALACMDSTRISVVRALLEARACVNGGTGISPLHVSCRFGHKEIVKLLLAEHGIEIDAQTNAPRATPMLLAAMNLQPSIASRLLRARASVNLANRHGATPLITACAVQEPKLVLKLLELRADPNLAASCAGTEPLTALHALLFQPGLPGMQEPLVAAHNFPPGSDESIELCDALFRAGAQIDERTVAAWRASPKLVGLRKIQQNSIRWRQRELHSGMSFDFASGTSSTDRQFKYFDEACAYCGESPADPRDLKMCAGRSDAECSARYCGRACQKIAWKAGHKASCGEPLPSYQSTWNASDADQIRTLREYGFAKGGLIAQGALEHLSTKVLLQPGTSADRAFHQYAVNSGLFELCVALLNHHSSIEVTNTFDDINSVASVQMYAIQTICNLAVADGEWDSDGLARAQRGVDAGAVEATTAVLTFTFDVSMPVLPKEAVAQLFITATGAARSRSLEPSALHLVGSLLSLRSAVGSSRTYASASHAKGACGLSAVHNRSGCLCAACASFPASSFSQQV